MMHHGALIEGYQDMEPVEHQADFWGYIGYL